MKKEHRPIDILDPLNFLNRIRDNFPNCEPHHNFAIGSTQNREKPLFKHLTVSPLTSHEHTDAQNAKGQAESMMINYKQLLQWFQEIGLYDEHGIYLGIQDLIEVKDLEWWDCGQTWASKTFGYSLFYDGAYWVSSLPDGSYDTLIEGQAACNLHNKSRIMEAIKIG